MNNRLSVYECPPEVRKAFDHIRKSHPTVVTVCYDSEAQWLYYDHRGKNPTFGEEIEVQVLQDAIDSIDNAGLLPAYISI